MGVVPRSDDAVKAVIVRLGVDVPLATKSFHAYCKYLDEGFSDEQAFDKAVAWALKFQKFQRIMAGE